MKDLAWPKKDAKPKLDTNEVYLPLFAFVEDITNVYLTHLMEQLKGPRIYETQIKLI